MYVAEYLGRLQSAEEQLAEALVAVSKRHSDTSPEVAMTGNLLSSWSRQHAAALAPVVAHYGQRHTSQPEQLRRTLFQEPRSGGLGLLRDLQDTSILAQEVLLDWTILGQAARALRDGELQELCRRLGAETQRQIDWLHTQLVEAAPEILTVPA